MYSIWSLVVPFVSASLAVALRYAWAFFFLSVFFSLVRRSSPPQKLTKISTSPVFRGCVMFDAGDSIRFHSPLRPYECIHGREDCFVDGAEFIVNDIRVAHFAIQPACNPFLSASSAATPRQHPRNAQHKPTQASSDSHSHMLRPSSSPC
ncbi:hypothetical protein B0J13DRAFT_518107 [Dactylonectria estremocensis]|uniref:Uncharacterized protein n=1 Tax=Dactylonectria estremocensis TaxID=1079267 RepID=A0A9P9FJ74_9HYPO|nr:hypothetical protein B0J13DRAFT_518107 [Dactylonectria estremocensis]